jgi:hypothetical protein
MQFVTKTSSLIYLHVMYKNKEMANPSNTKFLRLTLDNTFSWKNHIDTIVSKLSSACFTVRAAKQFLSEKSLRMMVYFSYFHSIMIFRLIFWGNSYHSNTVFKLQKRSMCGSWFSVGCTSLYPRRWNSSRPLLWEPWYWQNQNKRTPWHKWTIPTERPPLVGEVSANFCR